MAFEDVMGRVMGWWTEVEALAALGAELTLKQSGEAAPPEIVAALQSVSEAAGLGDLNDLTPQQRAVIIASVHLYLHQAMDVLEHPAREPGWTYTDPVILDGWGRGSTLVPAMLASATSDLKEVHNFLDMGTGVGLLAIAAAQQWPSAQVVGIDLWDQSLERARANISQAGLDDRITLRKQNVVDLDDVDKYDCEWVPTFFLTEEILVQALPQLLKAAAPGGWIMLGTFLQSPEPLMAAVGNLRTVRGGGSDLDPKRGVELLEQAGFTGVKIVPPPGPMPIQLIIGQKPSA